jgi:hypothetical protein
LVVLWEVPQEVQLQKLWEQGALQREEQVVSNHTVVQHMSIGGQNSFGSNIPVMSAVQDTAPCGKVDMLEVARYIQHTSTD